MRTCFEACVLSLLFLWVQIYPQIPNGDFEHWSGGEPVNWWTNNSTYTTITQSSDAHGGSSAVKGENVTTNDGVLQPLLISGIIGGHGFPVSQRYANITGYYKFNAVSTDNFSVAAAMFKAGQVIAAGGAQFFGASVYTHFSVPIYYSGGETPDSCQITITIGNNSGPVNAGSYFLLDDLLFQGTITGIDAGSSETPYSFALLQNYPNPFNPSTNVSFVIGSASGGSFVSLKVYDVLGNEVATLVNEEKPAGSYVVNFNASSISGELSSGIYFYRLQAGSQVQVRKMVVVK